MQLGEILTQNEGKDVCVCIEYPDGTKNNNVLKKYSVIINKESILIEGKKEYGNKKVSGLPKTFSEIKINAGRIMIRIKARYRDFQYHMYIAEYISDEGI